MLLKTLNRYFSDQKNKKVSKKIVGKFMNSLEGEEKVNPILKIENFK